MRLRVFVQGRKHDGQHDGGIFCEETHDVFVIPVVERAFGDLRKRGRVGGRVRRDERIELGSVNSTRIEPVV